MKTSQASQHIIKRSTLAAFDDVCQRVEEACSQHKFGVLGKIDLREKMNSKGVDFEQNCTVFEVCNPHKAQAVLAENMDVSSSLPCRLAIYTEAGQTVISTLKPTELLALYETPGAADEAREVEDTMAAIIEKLAQ